MSKTRSVTIRVQGFPKWKVNAKVTIDPDHLRDVVMGRIKAVMEHLIFYEYAVRTRSNYFEGQRINGLPYDTQRYDENIRMRKTLFVQHYEDILYSRVSMFVKNMKVKFLSFTITLPDGEVWDIDVHKKWETLSRSD